MTALLEAHGLSKHFAIRGAGLFARQIATLRAVDEVSLTIEAGRCLALVGESGCGKTSLARCLALLHRPSAGSISFDGEVVYDDKLNNYKAIRRDIQMVFQDPYGALNPRMTVAAIIAEPLNIHSVGDRGERAARVVELMESVGLSPALADRYPHEFSGGQRQRIGIARALALRPRLIIADEPVSALDVSVQSQVLNLMLDLQDAMGLSYLFIGHDLGVVEHMADVVAVMYLGRIVEQAPRDELFASPSHPYSQALLRSIPRPGGGKRARGAALGGEVPSPLDPPAGCPFHPRCPRAADICREARPLLEPVAGDQDHLAACHFKGET
ncbi:MAG: dipeptide ABC transporter ATP-binding protein [Alphaproteobacteria bacterium]